MQLIDLVVAAVVGLPQGVTTERIAPAALASLDALQAVQLDTARDQQDATDSLWRAAGRALNRGDYTGAAKLYDEVSRRYPSTTRAGDAQYWGAFALYKTADATQLRLARTMLETQRNQYPRARTLRAAPALLARIQTALAQQGDEAAARWLAEHARGPARGRAPKRADAPSRAPQAGCARDDDEDDLRMAALNGLLQMDAASAVPILRKVLARRDPCAAALRRKALFLVSQKRTTETEEILLDAARNDPDAEVRRQGVFWLSQVPTDRAVTMLDSILRTSQDRELQEKAVFALSQHESPHAGEILRAYAERADAPTDVRAQAIFWLGQRHGVDNAEYLRALYARLPNQDLKEKVLFSVSQLGGVDNVRWLMDLAVNQQEAPELRKKALFWAGQNGAAIVELVALYDRMHDEEMKQQLVFVYAQRSEPAAVDKLIAIAKAEPNHELRKKAIFWLGQSHDPRAAQALLEIIDQ
jgi:HEAT repeat protein